MQTLAVGNAEEYIFIKIPLKRCLLPLSPPKCSDYSGFVQISNYKNSDFFFAKTPLKERSPNYRKTK